MATKNDITGDSIQTKVNSDKFRDGWDAIFKKKVEENENESKLQDLDIQSDSSTETGNHDWF